MANKNYYLDPKTKKLYEVDNLLAQQIESREPIDIFKAWTYKVPYKAIKRLVRLKPEEVELALEVYEKA